MSGARSHSSPAKTNLNEPASSATNLPVQHRPTSRFFTGALSLLLGVAWLVASNHCAFAVAYALSQPTKATHEHCAGHAGSEQPEKKNGNGCGDQSCCKSLSAPALTLAKSPVAFDYFDFVTADYLAAVPAGLGNRHRAVVFELDTGPPAASSFAESVLQRSLLAHAPPFFT